MLEEKNDNLLDADGNADQLLQNNETTENQLDTVAEIKTLELDHLTENENSQAEGHEVALTDEELANDTLLIEPNIGTDEQVAIDAIVASNAADSADNIQNHEEIPSVDYESLTMENLVTELEKLVAVEKIMVIKNHVEDLKTAFLSKYNHFIEEKKDEYFAENPETSENFEYHFPLKVKFDQLYSQFRDKRNKHFKGLESNLKANLENRLSIVEELKILINPEENIKDALKHFNDLRERWKTAGPIPKDKYNHVWNNYHFHVENFYDYLHLDREARDLDFKHNLDLKLKIIARVEELVHEEDLNKSFRELQDLHKIWKEDIGPVSREYRDSIWEKFSSLTKIMHDKREQLFEAQRGVENDNLVKKAAIIFQINSLTSEKMSSNTSWPTLVEKVETFRAEFFAIGKVPNDVNEATWSAFKTAVRNFNVVKNSFYKDIKKEQHDNMNKKSALVAKAIALQESDDFETTTPIMKQIQEEWKTVGHVPRKFSDKIWKEFRAACNHYFEKLKAQKTEANQEEVEAFEKKKAYIENLKDFELVGEHKADLDAIKVHIEAWKSFGRVPFSRRHIDGKFNKILDALFEKLSLSKKDSEMMRFANRMEQLNDANDTRKLENEKMFLTKKIEEVQAEIFQLENNIQFFSNVKSAKKENPLVVEVQKNIEKHKENLIVLKEKLLQIKNLNIE